MLQVIEAAVEREPVEVVGGIVEGVLAVEVGDPAGEGLIGGESAIGGLPEVRVRGDEAGDDPGAVAVPGLGEVKVGGRVAGVDGSDGAVVGYQYVTVDGLFLAVGHGEDVDVGDEEFGIGGEGGQCGEGEEEEGAEDCGGGSFHICCYS